MIAKEYFKDPDAVLDYGFNWVDWLETGETISNSIWTVPTGITEDSTAYSNTATTIWLSGGTLNTDYEVINHITTSEDREDDRTLKIKVRQR